MAAQRYEISLPRGRKILYLQAAIVLCSVYYEKTNKMPNYFTLVRTVFEAIATVIFSHVKIITGIKVTGFSW